MSLKEMTINQRKSGMKSLFVAASIHYCCANSSPPNSFKPFSRLNFDHNRSILDYFWPTLDGTLG